MPLLRPMVPTKHVLLALGCLHLTTASCMGRQTRRASSPSTVTTISSDPTTLRSASPTALLMTPEQFIRHIKSQFGLDLAQNYKGQTSALQRYLLPLGGIDHDTVYERDRHIKVQNLLAVQAIAWEAALRIIEQEQKPKSARIFVQDNPTVLTPDSNRQAWIERVQDFFVLIDSRLPTDSELNFFESRVRQLLQQGATPVQTWTALAYTLLASVEFWYP